MAHLADLVEAQVIAVVQELLALELLGKVLLAA
jgi:hypothetical protein